MSLLPVFMLVLFNIFLAKRIVCKKIVIVINIVYLLIIVVLTFKNYYFIRKNRKNVKVNKKLIRKGKLKAMFITFLIKY